MDPAQFSALISFPFATLENRLSVIAQCCMIVDFFFKAYMEIQIQMEIQIHMEIQIQTFRHGWMGDDRMGAPPTERERESVCHLVSSLIEVQILVVARETPFRSWGVHNIKNGVRKNDWTLRKEEVNVM